MLRRFQTYATLAVMVFAVMSCSVNESVMLEEHGRFKLNISTNPAFSLADGTAFVPDDVVMPSEGDYSATLSYDGNSHTWPSVTDISSLETYRTGTYSVSVQSAGVPAFGATAEFDMRAGATTEVKLDCRPLQALVQVDASAENSSYSVVNVLSQGSEGPFKVLETEKDNYVAPGSQAIMVTLADNAGEERTLATGYESDLTAANAYNLEVKLDGATLSVGDKSRIITPAVFVAQPPQITPEGFVPGQTLTVIEGISLDSQPIMTAVSPSAIKHARLSISSPIIDLARTAQRFDLANLTSNQQSTLTKAGLQFSFSHDDSQLNVNFARMVEQLASYTTALSTFTLVVETIDGVCSEPLSLVVSTDVVKFEVVDTQPAVIGTDIATVIISSDVQGLERDDFQVVTTDGVICPITGFSANDKEVAISFSVPAGASDIDVKIKYLGLERAAARVGRVAPQTTLITDAFATTVVLVLQAGSEKATETMTRYAVPQIDGQRASIASRLPEKGIIIVNGLTPAQSYKLNLMVGNTASVATTSFTTEKAEQLPDGSFEDWCNSIEYKNLPSGGRYSATTAPLFNRQNYTDIDVKWIKKGWTSINAKTFNKSSKLHNTWYMQPSTSVVWEPQSGYKAMCLTSVGWDHDGAAIPDYVQQPNQNLLYNPNVPNVAHRSAGRLFLGSYKFAASTGYEVHDDGIAFGSRPSSLNGFYKYFPDVNATSDAGLVTISVYGKDSVGNEIIIATGEMHLTDSPDYKAFNVPLTYNMVGVRATRLCVMFASSFHIGSQEQEDATVPVTPNVVTSAMTGSSLFIDNLSLSY